jgi:hypothetical protein
VQRTGISFFKYYGAPHLLDGLVVRFLQTLSVRCTWLPLLISGYPKEKGFTLPKDETFINISKTKPSSSSRLNTL